MVSRSVDLPGRCNREWTSSIKQTVPVPVPFFLNVLPAATGVSASTGRAFIFSTHTHSFPGQFQNLRIKPRMVVMEILVILVIHET
jgi:hypothetical protein